MNRSSEKFFCQFFLSKYGIALLKIDEHGKAGRTPDFEFVKDGRRVFVCELKDLYHAEPSEESRLEITYHRDGSIEQAWDDNATNRISHDIRNAYNQLAGYSEPKVLAFLNHTYMLNCSDLEETYRGYSYIEADGITIKNTHARGASEGLKDKKSIIDLYIWIDATDSRIDLQQERVTFFFTNPIGRKIARDYFGKSEGSHH